LGSVPSGSSCVSNQQSYPFCIARFASGGADHLSVPALPYPMRKDSLAEVIGSVPEH
jgi:hypothetical protein